MFYILISSPTLCMHPGMESDPLRFLYLKYEYFLMTDWCDINISLIMKNSKAVTLCDLDLKVTEEVVVLGWCSVKF